MKAKDFLERLFKAKDELEDIISYMEVNGYKDTGKMYGSNLLYYCMTDDERIYYNEGTPIFRFLVDNEPTEFVHSRFFHNKNFRIIKEDGEKFSYRKHRVSDYTYWGLDLDGQKERMRFLKYLIRITK